MVFSGIEYRSEGVEKDIKKSIWSLVEKEAKSIEKEFPNDFIFNNNSESIFMQKFDDYIADIKSKFMQSDVVDLDSHKITAVIICSIIKSSVIKVKSIYDENRLLFDGNEKIAVNIGLSYMRAALKELLIGTTEEGKFDDYLLPKALMCDTDYNTILCRNLFYANKFYVLNPIDIANTLFLLENITLINLGIDLDVVRNKCQENIKENK